MEEKLNELSYKNALILGLLIGALYYFFIFRAADVGLQLETLEAEISQVDVEISEKDKRIKKMLKVEGALTKLNEKLKGSMSYIPLEFSSDEAVDIVSNKAREAGLSIEFIGAAGSWQDLKTISFSTVDVNLKGSYEQLMYFLSDITREARVFSVSRMTISAGGKPSGIDLGINGVFKVYKAKKLDSKVGAEDG